MTKRTTDSQFKRLVSLYRDRCRAARDFGHPIPLGGIQPIEGRTFTSYQSGYAAAVRDAEWRAMEAAQMWCLLDPVTGQWVHRYDHISEAGKAMPAGSITGKFVWLSTFSDVRLDQH